MKNVVLVYSYDHFLPGRIAKYEYSSSHLISKKIYETLSSIPNINVYYFDTRRIEDWVPIKADYLISIVDNLKLSEWFFEPKQTILVAVNKSPLERLALLNIAKIKQIPQRGLSGHDGIFEDFLVLRKVNTIIHIGNEHTFFSYTKYFKSGKLLPFYYDSNNFGGLPDLISSNNPSLVKNGILVSMSSLGLRKNYGFIDELLKVSSLNLQDYHFYIIGEPSTKYWEEIINSKIYLPNVTFIGWVPNLNSNNSKISDLLPKIKLALFPTNEDATPGMLLDCINFGILSLHNSKNSGLNVLIRELNSDFENVNEVLVKIKHIMSLNHDEYSDLQKIQLANLNIANSTKFTISEIIKLITTSNYKNNKIELNYKKIFLSYVTLPILSYFLIFARRIYVHSFRFRYQKFYLQFKKSKNLR